MLAWANSTAKMQVELECNAYDLVVTTAEFLHEIPDHDQLALAGFPILFSTFVNPGQTKRMLVRMLDRINHSQRWLVQEGRPPTESYHVQVIDVRVDTGANPETEDLLDT